MKKIIKIFKTFFGAIWNVIDRFIVMPITKFILFINNKLTNSGIKFEGWLSKPTTLLFLSLFLALTIFIAVDQKIIFYSESSAEVLAGQKVVPLFNSEAYVIEGLPETVDVSLIGNKADIYIAKQSAVGNVTVDLTRYIGTIDGLTKDVEIEYNQGLSSIEYKVNPSTVSVTIYKKDSLSTAVSSEILNYDKLDDKLSIDSITLKDSSTIIKGAKKYIKNVAVVKALVDVDKFSSQESGTFTLKDVPLKAYDENGDVVDVELVPSVMDVDVTLSESKKLVSIKTIPTGNIAFGLAISSIELSEKEVWIYGSSSEIANINYIPVDIDVNELSESKKYKMELTKPNGVKSMSLNNVDVTVNIDGISYSDINDVAINAINVGEGLRATAASKEDGSITVTVKGVKSVIDSITSDDIIASVDLNGLGVGTHKVPVIIEKTDVKIEYVSKKTEVTVQIVSK